MDSVNLDLMRAVRRHDAAGRPMTRDIANLEELRRASGTAPPTVFGRWIVGMATWLRANVGATPTIDEQSLTRPRIDVRATRLPKLAEAQ